MTSPRTHARTNQAQAPAPVPAKKTATKPARKGNPGRRPRKTTTQTTSAPALSLVKTPKPLPTRPRPFMTDIQGYATLAARIAGITTPHIRDWRDHRNGTTTRPLHDGSTLHYHLPTRTLTWQAVCPQGGIHTYRLDSPSTATAARVHANRCINTHYDTSLIPALTADELADLGLLHTPTWASRIPGEPPTTSIPAPLSPKDRALTEQTQPLSLNEIATGVAERAAADVETAKEHPQP